MRNNQPRNPNRLQFKDSNLVRNYLAAKQLMTDRLWSVANGKFITNYEGEYLSENEMLDRLPILKQSSLLTNLQNPNKRKNWSI